MEGGEGSSDQSPDFWWKDLRARPSPDFTLCSPEIAKKGGGVEKSGLIQTFSEENIMNPSLRVY